MGMPPLAERHPLSRVPRADGIEEDFEIASRGQAVALSGSGWPAQRCIRSSASPSEQSTRSVLV